MKKTYQQPQTTSIEVQPQSILCASPGGGKFISTSGTTVSGVYGD